MLKFWMETPLKFGIILLLVKLFISVFLPKEVTWPPVVILSHKGSVNLLMMKAGQNPPTRVLVFVRSYSEG